MAGMVASKDRSTIMAWFFRFNSEAEESYWNLRLVHLNAKSHYLCETTGSIYPGDVLMNVGLPIP